MFKTQKTLKKKL